MLRLENATKRAGEIFSMLSDDKKDTSIAEGLCECCALCIAQWARDFLCRC